MSNHEALLTRFMALRAPEALNEEHYAISADPDEEKCKLFATSLRYCCVRLYPSNI